MSWAVAFAGQGAEQPRMGVAIAEAFAPARALLDGAGPEVVEALHRGRAIARTEDLQPALVAVQLGAYAGLRAAGAPAPALALGHSLGELSAWSATGAVAPEDAVRLARARGEAMARAASSSPGGMLAIATRSLDVVGEALAAGRAAGALAIAAHNAEDEWVLAGDEPALRAAAATCGGRRLAVAGPWHAPSMAPARPAIAAALAAIDARPPSVAFVANATGEVAAPEAIPRLLERQLVRPVRWVRSMRAAIRAGVRTLVICGPGKPLRHLARGLDGLAVRRCEEPADLARLAAELGR